MLRLQWLQLLIGRCRRHALPPVTSTLLSCFRRCWPGGLASLCPSHAIMQPQDPTYGVINSCCNRTGYGGAALLLASISACGFAEYVVDVRVSACQFRAKSRHYALTVPRAPVGSERNWERVRRVPVAPDHAPFISSFAAAQIAMHVRLRAGHRSIPICSALCCITRCLSTTALFRSSGPPLCIAAGWFCFRATL